MQLLIHQLKLQLLSRLQCTHLPLALICMVETLLLPALHQLNISQTLHIHLLTIQVHKTMLLQAHIAQATKLRAIPTTTPLRRHHLLTIGNIQVQKSLHLQTIGSLQVMRLLATLQLVQVIHTLQAHPTMMNTHIQHQLLAFLALTILSQPMMNIHHQSMLNRVLLHLMDTLQTHTPCLLPQVTLILLHTVSPLKALYHQLA